MLRLEEGLWKKNALFTLQKNAANLSRFNVPAISLYHNEKCKLYKKRKHAT